jgi:polyphenol oxidase
MQDWQWHEQSGISYLTCTLLQSWQHGFFGRSTWPAKPETLVPQCWGDELLTFRTKQVHGKAVLPVEDLNPLHHSAADPSDLADADGLIASPQAAPLGVWVASADCTPVLIGDVSTRQVAAIHSGWRGTAAEIVPAAVTQLLERGSQLQDLRIALGPAISGSVYPVDRSVALQVCETIAPSPLNLETLDEVMDSLGPSPLLPDLDPTKVRLDVRQVIATQLQQLGIATEQVSIAPYCTYQNPDTFFSYRRTGEKAVQWSGIVAT